MIYVLAKLLIFIIDKVFVNHKCRLTGQRSSSLYPAFLPELQIVGITALKGYNPPPPSAQDILSQKTPPANIEITADVVDITKQLKNIHHRHLRLIPEPKKVPFKPTIPAEKLLPASLRKSNKPHPLKSIKVSRPERYKSLG
jgi:hypothetical protein